MSARKPGPRLDGRRNVPAWRLLDLGRCAPLRAVAFAEAVARFVARGDVPNTLLFARPASPCVSVGFHQTPEAELEPAFVRGRRLPVIRRVEGGGTVYLDPDQLFYQFVYAGTDESPGGPSDFARYLSAPVEAARALGLDARLRPPSDIVVGGRKISGNAGGEWDGAHLISGDLLGRSDVGAMADVLRLPHPALRPLVRREIARWMTSWEIEAGRPPEWPQVQRGMVEGFSKFGLGRLEKGRPTEEEEAAFRSETIPRHEDPSWQDPASPSPATGQPRRKIRVAGPHGIVVFDDPSGPGLWVGVADGSRVVGAYALEPGPKAKLRPLRAGAPERVELAARLRTGAGFE